MGLYSADGSSQLASEDALAVPWFDDAMRQVPLRGSAVGERCEPWPSADRWVSHIDGTYRAQLPEGTYTPVLTHGHEYRRVTRQVRVAASEETNMTVQLERWIDLPKNGWYSGDNHVHMTRSRDDDAVILGLARAEDVHVTNLLAMGNLEVAYYDQYAYGPAGQASEGGHALVSGQEDPRTSRTGHTIHLNTASRVRHQDSYFVYHEAFEELRRGGALSGYAHVGSGWFNEARGLALDVPFGIVDLVEVLQGGELHTDLWYDFLNLGYRLTPSAGSDHPYIDLLGTVRTYAQVNAPFTAAKWFEALRQGRAFVSSGPVVRLEVVGRASSTQIDLTPGERIEVQASAMCDEGVDQLHRLELVVAGEPVAQAVSVAGTDGLALAHDMQPSAGTWVAARCHGSYGRAHTAPVYLTTNQGTTSHAGMIPDIVDRMQAHLRELVDDADADARRELERWISPMNYATEWRQQHARIKARAQEAHRRYDRLRSRATA
jgi:hypothetical protein